MQDLETIKLAEAKIASVYAISGFFYVAEFLNVVQALSVEGKLIDAVFSLGDLERAAKSGRDLFHRNVLFIPYRI